MIIEYDSYDFFNESKLKPIYSTERNEINHIIGQMLILYIYTEYTQIES